MASIDGTASDELSENCCDPCKYDGLQNAGPYYCETCDEYLCPTCRDSHKRFKATRNHTVVSSKDVNRDTQKAERFIVFCACEHNARVLYFCSVHDKTLCQTCKDINHRKCSVVPLQEKVVDYDVSKFDSALVKVKSLIEDFTAFLESKKSSIQELERMAAKCKEEIRSVRKDIESFLNALEDKMFADLEELTGKVKEDIENQVMACSSPLRLLEVDSQLLENAKRSNDKVMMFASDVQVSVHLKKLHTLLQDCLKEAEAPVLEFEKDETLMRLMKDVQRLGKLKANDLQETTLDRKSFLNMKVGSTRLIDVKLLGDKNNPWITGCAFMSDGQLVLADYNNKNIKVLSSLLKICSSLKVDSPPRGLAVKDNAQIVVALPELKTLQFVQVVPSLQTGKTIQLDKKCYGVTIVDECIYVLCHDDPGNSEVRILNVAGKLIKKISITFRFPYYFSVGTGSKNIFVSDWATSTLACLTSGGNTIYTYCDANMNHPRQPVVDDEDNVLVPAEDSINIHMFTAGGKHHGVLFETSESRKPCSLAYRRSDDLLVVGCRDKNALIIVNLDEVK